MCIVVLYLASDYFLHAAYKSCFRYIYSQAESNSEHHATAFYFLHHFVVYYLPFTLRKNRYEESRKYGGILDDDNWLDPRRREQEYQSLVNIGMCI